MAIDTPARIAVIGAGPIGLEVALYARFLGYDVNVFERGSVGDHVRHWGHVPLFTPFSMNHSSLGRAAIDAQFADHEWPEPEARVTGTEWADRYLVPLSKVDLMANRIHCETEVISVGKESYLKSEMASYDDRFDELFLILTRSSDGQESWHEADIVIDASGTFSRANRLGPGGMPAAGESDLESHSQSGSPFSIARPALSFRLPDILGEHRDSFADRTVLVMGNGYSAATNLQQLLALRKSSPETRIIWLVRDPQPTDDSPFPIRRFADDRLPARDTLAAEVNDAAMAAEIELISGRQVKEIRSINDASWAVTLTGDEEQTLEVDVVLANVGFRGDWTLSEELQVHRCYASEGPMKWSATLLKEQGADCLDAPESDGQPLITTEPNFYVIGSKSYGRWSSFLFQTGLTQVRQLFSVIADRSDLDLYAQPLGTTR